MTGIGSLPHNLRSQIYTDMGDRLLLREYRENTCSGQITHELSGRTFQYNTIMEHKSVLMLLLLSLMQFPHNIFLRILSGKIFIFHVLLDSSKNTIHLKFLDYISWIIDDYRATVHPISHICILLATARIQCILHPCVQIIQYWLKYYITTFHIKDLIKLCTY